MKDPKELASGLKEYAKRHRMMMGQTPDNQLIEAAAEFISGTVDSEEEPEKQDSKRTYMKESIPPASKPRGRPRKTPN